MKRHISKFIDSKHVRSPDGILVLETNNNITIDTDVDRILINGVLMRDYIRMLIFESNKINTDIHHLEDSSLASSTAKVNFDAIYAGNSEFIISEAICGGINASETFINENNSHVISLEGHDTIYLNAKSIDNFYIQKQTLREVIYNIMNEYRINNQIIYDIKTFQHKFVARSTIGKESSFMGTMHTNTLVTQNITTKNSLIHGEEPDLIIRSSAGVQLNTPNLYLNNQVFHEYIKQFLDERDFFSFVVTTQPGSEIHYQIINFTVTEHNAIFDYDVRLFMYNQNVSSYDIRSGADLYDDVSISHTINRKYFPFVEGKPSYNGIFTSLTPGTVYNMYADVLNLKTSTLVPKVHVMDGILTVTLKGFEITILNETHLLITVYKYEEAGLGYGNDFKFNILLNRNTVTDSLSDSELLQYPNPDNPWTEPSNSLVQTDQGGSDTSISANQLKGIFIYSSVNTQLSGSLPNNYRLVNTNKIHDFNRTQSFRVFTQRLSIMTPPVSIDSSNYQAFLSVHKPVNGPLINSLSISGISLSELESETTYTLQIHHTNLATNWPKYTNGLQKFNFFKFYCTIQEQTNVYSVNNINTIVQYSSAATDSSLKINIPNDHLIENVSDSSLSLFSEIIALSTNISFSLKYSDVYDIINPPETTGTPFILKSLSSLLKSSSTCTLSASRTFTVTHNKNEISDRVYMVTSIEWSRSSTEAYNNSNGTIITSLPTTAASTNLNFQVQIPNITSETIQMSFKWRVMDDLGRIHYFLSSSRTTVTPVTFTIAYQNATYKTGNTSQLNFYINSKTINGSDYMIVVGAGLTIESSSTVNSTTVSSTTLDSTTKTISCIITKPNFSGTTPIAGTLLISATVLQMRDTYYFSGYCTSSGIPVVSNNYGIYSISVNSSRTASLYKTGGGANGSISTYQWKVNGVNVATTTTFPIPNSTAAGASVTCTYVPRNNLHFDGSSITTGTSFTVTKPTRLPLEIYNDGNKKFSWRLVPGNSLGSGESVSFDNPRWNMGSGTNSDTVTLTESNLDSTLRLSNGKITNANGFFTDLTPVSLVISAITITASIALSNNALGLSIGSVTFNPDVLGDVSFSNPLTSGSSLTTTNYKFEIRFYNQTSDSETTLTSTNINDITSVTGFDLKSDKKLRLYGSATRWGFSFPSFTKLNEISFTAPTAPEISESSKTTNSITISISSLGTNGLPEQSPSTMELHLDGSKYADITASDSTATISSLTAGRTYSIKIIKSYTYYNNVSSNTLSIATNTVRHQTIELTEFFRGLNIMTTQHANTNICILELRDSTSQVTPDPNYFNASHYTTSTVSPTWQKVTATGTTTITPFRTEYAHTALSIIGMTAGDLSERVFAYFLLSEVNNATSFSVTVSFNSDEYELSDTASIIPFESELNDFDKPNYTRINYDANRNWLGDVSLTTYDPTPVKWSMWRPVADGKNAMRFIFPNLYARAIWNYAYQKGEVYGRQWTQYNWVPSMYPFYYNLTMDEENYDNTHYYKMHFQDTLPMLIRGMVGSRTLHSTIYDMELHMTGMLWNHSLTSLDGEANSDPDHTNSERIFDESLSRGEHRHGTNNAKFYSHTYIPIADWMWENDWESQGLKITVNGWLWGASRYQDNPYDRGDSDFAIGVQFGIKYRMNVTPPSGVTTEHMMWSDCVFCTNKRSDSPNIDYVMLNADQNYKVVRKHLIW